MKPKGNETVKSINIKHNRILCSLGQFYKIFEDRNKKKHSIYSNWVAESLFGAIGSILNSICLSIFLIGRDQLLSTVNLTIW